MKYRVSDFLKDRHPYYPSNGFESQRERDAGKVFNGYDRLGMDELMTSLLSPAIDAPQRAVALRHLLAYSASSEKKLSMLRGNMVGLLSGVLTSSRGAPTDIECLVHQLFRSLAVVPQGCVHIMKEGGLSVLLHSLNDRSGGAERAEARLFAATALSQMVTNYAGREWLLGGPGAAKEFELPGRDVSVMTDAQRLQAPEDAIQTIVNIFEKDGREQPKILRYCSVALAALSAANAGLHTALIAGALRVVTRLLTSYSADDAWLRDESIVDVDVVLHLATFVWHAGLDPVGLKEAQEESQLLGALGQLVAAVCKIPPTAHFQLKSALAGAIGALTLQPDMKKVALQPLPNNSENTVDVVVRLLSQVDELIYQLLSAKKEQLPAPFLSPTEGECVATIKNGIQMLRLVAELPDGRTLLHKKLPNDDASTEALRRMVFFSTVWQDEFGVHVY